PPMMWIFEWDIVTGDSAVWDTIYTVNRDRPNLAVREGIDAVLIANEMRDLVAETDPATWRDPELRRHFMSTMDFQVSLFNTLGYYREARLRHAEWLDTGSAEAKDAWQAAAARYDTHRAEHLRRYAGNLDLPAYNLTAADIGLDRAARDAPMAWLARALLVLVLAVLALGSPWAARRVKSALWARALWTASTRPWRLAGLDGTPSRRDRVLVWAVPAVAVVASRAILTSFAAPAHLVVVLGAWLLCTVALRLSVRRADPFTLLAALGGVALLRTVLLLLVLAVRGPGYYWFGFWTAPTARTVYVTLAFAAFLAVFGCAYVVLRGAYGLSRVGTTGRVLVAAGVPLAVLGALVTILGAERALTLWNDQLALLPWGLSRILGITVHLEIPTDLPLAVTLAGAVVVLAGAAMTFLGRPRRPGVPL
ncbi:MAG TPA: hypothetical protein VNP92_26170, partial [Actinophytocola sp.]|nr:hypothetical protein [Actinophytocola sp.]